VSPVTEAIDTFQERHPWWSRPEAVEVIRETRKASRDLKHFAFMVGLTPAVAWALWVSGSAR